MNLLFLAIGLSVGAIAVYLILNERLKQSRQSDNELNNVQNKLQALTQSKIELEQNLKVLDSRYKMMEEEKNRYTENIKLLTDEITDLNKTNAVLITENKNLEEKLNSQKDELTELNKKFTVEFENIANRLFEKSSTKINQQSSEQLNQILKPFKERLSDLKSQINNTYEKDNEQRILLREQVKHLFDLNRQISTDAQNLTNALKSNSKVQGDWGEEILENILQQSGLHKNREYDVQSSFTNEEGKILRPDMIVHYPDNRDIVIDAKVSLTDYERYMSAENKVDQEIALKNHIHSIKQHIKELSEKNYQDLYQIETLDFVMMFVPIEGAYYLAIENEPTLWQYAYEKKIVLINPTNLITALKMISNLWQQDYQNKNVMEIARQSGGLYDSFVLLLDDLSKIEKKMNETQELFTNTQKRIATGKGNLIGRVEKIKKLGAKTKKSLPDKYTDALTDVDDA